MSLLLLLLVVVPEFEDGRGGGRSVGSVVSVSASTFVGDESALLLGSVSVSVD